MQLYIRKDAQSAKTPLPLSSSVTMLVISLGSLQTDFDERLSNWTFLIKALHLKFHGCRMEQISPTYLNDNDRFLKRTGGTIRQCLDDQA